jgi:type I site-specific restriction-modification system R (restriction) subunit
VEDQQQPSGQELEQHGERRLHLAHHGLGKTLTSFKAARLATELDFIDKVFFVVDRKDLDYQTMKEYQRFSPDSVNGSDSTAGLKRNLEKDDNKIVVTTIQKLNNLMKSEATCPSTASRWCSSSTSATAASLAKPRRT